MTVAYVTYEAKQENKIFFKVYQYSCVSANIPEMQATLQLKDSK